MNLSRMALNQTFGNRRSKAKVAINLEWRMICKAIWIHRARNQRTDVSCDSITIAKTRFKTRQPRAAPACVSASGEETSIQCFPKCGHEVRRFMKG